MNIQKIDLQKFNGQKIGSAPSNLPKNFKLFGVKDESEAPEFTMSQLKSQLEENQSKSFEDGYKKGSEDITQYIEKKLSIKDGETTKDGMFTLKTVECLGSCGTAPMMQCGHKYYENLTTDSVDEIISTLKEQNQAQVYVSNDFFREN
jgi:(2Fe-2S) ferredoxin